MNTKAYYNEIDPFAAAWLRNLISAGLIAPGDVDERSIVDVKPDDLRGYCQCHFFSGIGLWSLAFRLAGIPDYYPVWSGSAPCQPYSTAGKRKGNADARNLWPEMFRLINACQPRLVFGEQVASSEIIGKRGAAKKSRCGDTSKAGPVWLDGIFDDLERSRYACGATVVGAFSVSAPHIRQRLYWVADSGGERPIEPGRIVSAVANGRTAGNDPRISSIAGGIPDATEPRLPWRQDAGTGCGDAGENGRGSVELKRSMPVASNVGIAGRIPDAERERRERREGAEAGRGSNGHDAGRVEGDDGPVGTLQAANRTKPLDWRGLGSVAASGFWSDSTLIPCRDGMYRRVPAARMADVPGFESPLQRMAHGHSRRMADPCPDRFPLAPKSKGRPGKLRAIGNAIVPELAAEFIRAYMETDV